MITTSQRTMLFGLWKRANAVLMPGRETWTKHEEDQRRRELTRDAIDEEKSWSDLSNSDVDKLKGALLAIIKPGDLNAQLRQLNQERNRLLHGIRRLKRELDVTDAYIQGIIDRMNAEGDLGTSDIDDLGPDELRKVLIALRKYKRRGGGTVAEPKRRNVPTAACLHVQTEEPF
jgi:hypothetical protein